MRLVLRANPLPVIFSFPLHRMQRARGMHAALLLLALCLFNHALAADAPLRRLFVSGSAGGVLEMRIPADWTRSGPSTPIDLRFARTGAGDNLRLTAFPVPPERVATLTDDKLQESLRTSGAKVVKESMEQKFDIKPLAVAGGKGYYYMLTDKSLEGKPDKIGSFRYLHSGVVLVGGWFGVFSVFSNQADGAFVKESLAAMQSLRWAEAEVVERAAAKGLARARLDAAPVPTEWQKKDELQCRSTQAVTLYEQFNDLYGRMLGARTVKTSFESYDAGNGDSGSVLYLEFDSAIKSDVRAFVAGLLWGDRLPTPAHNEEFFVAGKQMVIWCTRTESAIKRLSQTRLEGALFAR